MGVVVLPLKKSTHVMPEARRGKNEAAEVFVSKGIKNTKILNLPERVF